ncbi:MAG TPA: aldehyde-activating protein, partial [Rhodospirillales bacterium]|nr:aldehyde-activating protein [Rhodospirillales bacterium]
MSETITGGCQCGAVRYESTGDVIVGAHCHCDNCRKFSGAGHASNMLVSADGFSVSGEMSSYQYKADSGNDMARYFCPKCGSPVYGTSSANSAVVVLRAGGLDNPQQFQAKVSLFTPHAMAWDHIDH